MPQTGQVQIIGGHFQDLEGNLLSHGYLVMELSQDSQGTSPTPEVEVGAGIKIKVPLDVNGDIQGTNNLLPPPDNTPFFVWSNDVLNPAGSTYTVRAFDANGRLCWGPNIEQVLSSPSPFNVGVWVPNSVSGGGSGSPVGSILLQTNAINNGSQSKLNLHSGSGISLADSGTGQITIANTGATVQPTFKTNGVNNGSQAILNLKNGSGIAITDDGVGGITFATAGSGSANIAFWGGISPVPLVNSSAQIIVDSVTLRAVKFNVFTPTVVSQIGGLLVNPLGVGSLATCAIYSANGSTRLIYAGDSAFSAPAGVSTTVGVTITPVVLAAGEYWFVARSDQAISSDPCLGMDSNIAHAMNSGPTVRIGKITVSGLGSTLPTSVTIVADTAAGSTGTFLFSSV